MAFLVGTLITWLMHSSLSMVLLVMAFAGAHAIPEPLALALVLGANVGGAIAPLTGLAACAARRPPRRHRQSDDARGRGAAVHLPGPALRRAAGAGRSRPGAHGGQLPYRLQRDCRARAAAVRAGCSPSSTVTPPARPAGARRHGEAEISRPQRARHAVGGARLRHARDAQHGRPCRRHAAPGARSAIEKSDLKLVRDVEEADNAVDHLHEAIKLYLVKASKAEMSEEESRRYVEILTFTTNLEHIGDIIDKNLMELAAKKIKHNYTFSPEGLDEIRRFHARVMDNMQLAFNVFATRDLALARRLFAEKTAMRAAEIAAADSHFARLREGRAESIETSSIHLDVIRDLKRIHGHIVSVAYPILEAAGELRDTRLVGAGRRHAPRQAGRRMP